MILRAFSTADTVICTASSYTQHQQQHLSADQSHTTASVSVSTVICTASSYTQHQQQHLSADQSHTTASVSVS